MVTWDDQRAFLAVLEAGSLSEAARRLGLTQPTVRTRLEALENALGTVLFTRSARGLVPTEQARSLGEFARTMAQASEAFVREAHAEPGEVAGTVRLTVAELVGVELLPRMLAELRARHPALGIEVEMTNTTTDLITQEADIAVRMYPPRHAGLVARKAAAIPLGLFAHPDYLARRGVPKDLAECMTHDLIGPDRERRDLEVLEQFGVQAKRERFVIRTDSHPAQLAAARAGLGIAVTHKPLGNADPNLRAVLPDFTFATLDTWVVAAESLLKLPRVRAVFDHLVESLQAYAQ